MNRQKGMDLMGLKVRDKITGYEGVIESICYDLYGCVQACIRPEYVKNEKHELGTAHWFDISRVKVLDKKPVMDVPDFELEPHGGVEHPEFASKPSR